MTDSRHGEGGKRARISRSGDFDRVYREGRSHANRFLVLYAFPRQAADESSPRLGVSVGKRVGGAVDRNQVKRALREAFWDLEPSLPDRHDFVIVARPDLSGLIERDGTAGVAGILVELMRDGGLLRDGGRNT